jgi:hypothetical protein
MSGVVLVNDGGTGEIMERGVGHGVFIKGGGNNEIVEVRGGKRERERE